jgi:hypothetical protein
MKAATHFDYDNYDKYRTFILNCSMINYDEKLVLHKHHIIPKNLWTDENLSVNNKSNFVNLSVEDHIKAHLLLAECYENDTREHIVNLRSARILNKKSIKDVEILNKIKNSYIGENNPFYGKTHSEQTKQKLSLFGKNREYKTYKEQYGDNADLEKTKRKTSVKAYWDNLSEEDRLKRSNAVSESLKGKQSGSNNGFATKVLIDNVIYGSIKEACNALNVNHYYLYKNYCVKKLNKQK